MLDRKTAAKAASSIFYEEYNDVDIFIEDTAVGYRKIFKELLNRALNGRFSIEQVFPIGNRAEVIKECEKNQLRDGRKKVFIVDGDFFLLNGEDRDNLNGLYVLPRYCVENYLLDETSISQAAYEEEPEMDIEDILDKLKFNLWLEENEKKLLDLFIIYAICFKNIPAEQTIGYKVTKLCSSNNGIVCPIKIDQRIDELRIKLIAHFGEPQLNLEISKIKEKIKERDKKLIRFVSAKDYLLPLMITRLQSFLKFSSNNTTIKVKLAMKADSSELADIENYFFGQ